MHEQLILWLEENMTACSTKSLTGLSCFGCGLQRSVIHLLRGDFVESIIMYPPLIPFLLMMIALPLHLKFKFRHGAMVLKVMFILNAALMALNVVVKNIDHF